MRKRDFARKNEQVLLDFLAGVTRENRRKTVCSRAGNWEGTEVSSIFLTVNGEDVAAHHDLMGYVVAKKVAGRHARKVRDNLLTILAHGFRWAWDE